MTGIHPHSHWYLVKVTVITTTDHNVGDDFVREGILHLLSQLADIQVASIHKHLPITARPAWRALLTRKGRSLLSSLPGVSALGLTRRVDARLPLNRRTDKVLNSDLLVQCGTPVYWLHGQNSCAANEWFAPLVRRRWLQVRERVPLLNVAGGTCQTFHSDGAEFARSEETLEYIQEFFDLCSLTTVRDPLALSVLQHADRSAEVIPCPSLFAADRLRVSGERPEFVVLNYMRGGGHYAYGEKPTARNWERTFLIFVSRLPCDEKYKFVCHTPEEAAELRRIMPKRDVLCFNTPREYLAVYARAKYGIVNRVHAAFAMAGFGRPCHVIGNDSRVRMMEAIGLSSSDAEGTTPERLADEFDRLRSTWTEYGKTLARIKIESRETYLRLMKPIVGSVSNCGRPN